MNYIKSIKQLTWTILFLSLFAFNISAKDQNPDPVTWKNEVKELLYNKDEVIFDGSDIFSLDTPYRALDAAIVPITINFFDDQSDNRFVKSLVLVVDENPSPIVSKFNFSKKIGNASLTTRIRIDKYTYVRAIVELNDNKKYMVSNYVKAAGGCSAPSLADMDAVMVRLGKLKMKFIKTGEKGTLNKSQFLVSHPNYSGLQFNQLTRSEIPAHFINYVKIEQDNELIFEAIPDISLSEDPSFIFNYINSGGPLKVTVTDSEGGIFSKNFSSSRVASK